MSKIPGAALDEKDAKALARAKVDYEKNKDGTVVVSVYSTNSM